MESSQGRKRLEETLIKRHGRKQAALLVENLSQDGLLDDILSILNKIGLIEELLEGYSETAPEIITKYKASREAIYQRLVQLLDTMIKDPFYNKKILANRSVLLSGSIRRYREKIVAIFELIESVLIEIEKDLLLALKSKARKVRFKLEEVEGLISELKVRKDAFSSLDEGAHLLNQIERSLHLNAAELMESIRELNRIDIEISNLKMKLESSLKIQRNVRKLLEDNKLLLTQIEKTWDFINQSDIEAPFIKELIDKNTYLLRSIEEKEVEIDISNIRDDMVALEVMKKELLEFLEIVDQIKAFILRLRKAEKLLPKVLRTCLILDSMVGKGTFETVYYSLAQKLNSVRQDRTMKSADQFKEKSAKLKVVEDLMIKLVDIGKLVREISRADSELKTLAGINEWKKEIRLITPSETPDKRIELVLSYLKEVSEKLQTWKQKIDDAKKMYPLWKNRVVKELSADTGVSLEQISSIPQEWKEWVVKKLMKEGVVEEREGFFFLRKKSSELKRNMMREELRDMTLRIRKKIEEIHRLPSLKEKEKKVLEGIIIKLENIEDKIELIEDENDYENIKEEIGKLKGVLEVFIVEIKGGVPD